MSVDYNESLDLEYIVGRPLTVGDRDFWPGEDLPQEYVEQIPLIESWISGGYIYRVHPALGYNRLPPHIYTTVITRKEAEAKLEGDPGITGTIDANQHVSGNPSLPEPEPQAQAKPKLRRTGPTAEDKASAVEVTTTKEK